MIVTAHVEIQIELPSESSGGNNTFRSLGTQLDKIVNDLAGQQTQRLTSKLSEASFLTLGWLQKLNAKGTAMISVYDIAMAAKVNDKDNGIPPELVSLPLQSAYRGMRDLEQRSLVARTGTAGSQKSGPPRQPYVLTHHGTLVLEAELVRRAKLIVLFS